MPRLVTVLAVAVLVTTFHAGVSVAAPDNSKILERECHKQLKLGDSACACIGDQAAKQLNENQQALVVAMVTKDQAASESVQAQMTVEERVKAGKFMQDAPSLCASQ